MSYNKKRKANKAIKTLLKNDPLKFPRENVSQRKTCNILKYAQFHYCALAQPFVASPGPVKNLITRHGNNMIMKTNKMCNYTQKSKNKLKTRCIKTKRPLVKYKAVKNIIKLLKRNKGIFLLRRL